MSFGMSINMNDTEYSVKESRGCTFIYGSIPIPEFAAISKRQEQGAIISGDLARMTGATFTIGMPEDIRAYKDAISDEVIARTRNMYDTFGLSDMAVEWLAVGEQGSSSQAMFYAITGVMPQRFSQGTRRSHPHDPDDFSRCYKLVKVVPELSSQLGKVAELSDTWATIILEWDNLCALFEEGNNEHLYQKLKSLTKREKAPRNAE